MGDILDIIGSLGIQIIVDVVIAVCFGLLCRTIVRRKLYPDWENHGFAWGFWLNVIGVIVCSCKREYRYPKSQTYLSQNVLSNSGIRSSYSTPPSNNSTSTRTITKQNFADKVKTLYDDRDTKTTVTVEQQKRVIETRSVEKTVKKSYCTSNGKQTIELDMTWSQGLADLIEATELVYTNAELNCQSRLSSERFQYYINLHYRSFTAADLCHYRVHELYAARKSFGTLIHNLKDRENPLRVAKEDFDQICRAQETIRTLIPYLETRRDYLNDQTAKIRDKIRDECGTKGIIWFNELQERKKL